jgi:hypothetical protein
MRAYGCVVVSAQLSLKANRQILSLLYGPGLTDMFFHHNRALFRLLVRSAQH